MSNKTPKADAAKTASAPKRKLLSDRAFYWLVYGTFGLVVLFCIFILGPALAAPDETNDASQITIAFNCVNTNQQLVQPGQEAEDDSCETATLWLADDEAERNAGLSNYESDPAQAGMFFDFGQAGSHRIWMKDMLFPLHLVWLDGSMKVIDIQYDVAPETYPNTFQAKQPATYLLEIDANNVSQADLPFKVGDQVYK